MSATLIQQTKISDGVANNPSAAMSLTCSAGNAVILLAACVTKTRTISSVTDSASNTGWAHANPNGGGASGAGYCDIWWNPALPAGITTVTLNYNLSTKVQIGVLEVSGLAGTVDAAPARTDNTVATTAPAQAITTTAADTLIVCGCGAVTVPSAVASPFTLSAGASGGGGVGLNMGVATVEELTSGTYTATWTTVSEVSTTTIASFAVATAAADFSQHRRIAYPPYAPPNYSYR